MTIKFPISRFAGLILVLASACGRAGPNEPPQDPRQTVLAPLATLQAEHISFPYTAVGTVQPKVKTQLSAKTLGHIQALYVTVGDRVSAGQVLIELDARDVNARLMQSKALLQQAQHALEEVRHGIEASRAARSAAEANLQLADKTFQRFRELRERNSVSQQEFDEAEARYKAALALLQQADETVQSRLVQLPQVEARIQQAEAGVQEAEVYSSYSRVRSPLTGLVLEKHADLGDLAMPGQPLLTLGTVDRYRLEAAVDESRISRVTPDQRVPVYIQALGQELQGRVAEIVPAADPSSRSFLVKIELPAAGVLRSGMYGKAYFPGEETQVNAAPVTAVVQKGQLNGVFVVDESSVARFRLVKIGREIDGRLEILSGLEPGERFVVDPGHEVQDGVKVRETDGKTTDTNQPHFGSTWLCGEKEATAT